MKISARRSPFSQFRSGGGPRFTHDSTCLSVAGNYSFVTSRDSLRLMLRRAELPWTVLEKFETGIYSPKGAPIYRRRTQRVDPRANRLLRRLAPDKKEFHRVEMESSSASIPRLGTLTLNLRGLFSNRKHDADCAAWDNR